MDLVGFGWTGLDWVGRIGLVRRVRPVGRVRRDIGRAGVGLLRRGGEPRLGLPFAPYLGATLGSGRRCTVAIGIADVRVVVEFGVGFGEGLVGDGREEVLEGHAGKPDFGVRQRSVGIVIGIGFGLGFSFLDFTDFEEFFGDAHFSHEFSDFWTGTVEKATILFKLVKLFGSKARAPIGEKFFLDVRAAGPFPEFLLFPIGGGGLTESEPVALDLEEIVGDGGAAETRDVVGELSEGSPFAVGVGFRVDVAGHGGVLELGPEEEFVSNAMSAMREVVRVASCVFRVSDA